MTKKEINVFEKLQSQLEGLHEEINTLSKKSQNGALNLFKLNFVNQILTEANKLLSVKYKPFKDFHKFEENEMPSNSDASLMLIQYLNCMEKLRADNIDKQGFSKNWFWIVDGKLSNIRTKSPKIIKEK